MVKQKQHSGSMIDMSIMHEVFGNNPTAILKFLERFIETTSILLKNLDLAIQKQNQPEVMNDLHQLKGVAGSIGFKKMDILCEKIEKEVTKADWTAGKKTCADMEAILKKLDDYLQNKLR